MNASSASRRTAVAAILAVALVAGRGTAYAQTIVPAPAFNAERLSTLPRDEWITNGGTIWNQRYSPLDLINRGNVAGLKGVWRTGLESGAGPGNSAQAQILVFEGVMYVSSGDSDVFALDIDTGEILWEYRANMDRRAGNPFGRSNRGVAIGEGKVYGAQLYGETCLPCHGPDGGGGEGGGAPLTSALTRDVVLATMTQGRNTMPAFGELYTTEQMRDIAAFVVERLTVGRD